MTISPTDWSEEGAVVGRTRVLLADDNLELLMAIEGLIGTRFEIVAMVRDDGTLVREVKRLLPEVLVADIPMLGMTGLQAIRVLHQDDIRPNVVILTVHEDPEIVGEALACGAIAYVLKSAADRDLIPAIEAAAAGKVFVSASLQS